MASLKRKLESGPLPAAKAAKSERTFKDSWKIGRPWLKYDASNKTMSCDTCIKAQRSNTFTCGCTILKKESVTKHEKSKGI